MERKWYYNFIYNYSFNITTCEEDGTEFELHLIIKLLEKDKVKNSSCGNGFGSIT
ncbi:MAG TPA: hypothetical protein VKM55_13265 [Candidatus Lokiarchaeia archaeon]|nr:hypothetical protein [Candidatus Lokiarchaeia archaeon]